MKNKQENGEMNRRDEEGEKRTLKERIITTLKAEKMNAVCLKSGNCPSPQLSFIAAHRHVATLATEPNKPLDRISFLISQTMLGSTLPRSCQTITRSLYLQMPLHTVLQIKDNCGHASIYLL